MCCAKNRRCASSRVTKRSWYYPSNCTPITYRTFDLKRLVIEPECSKWRSFRTMLTWTTSYMRRIIHGFTNIVVFSTMWRFKNRQGCYTAIIVGSSYWKFEVSLWNLVAIWQDRVFYFFFYFYCRLYFAACSATTINWGREKAAC